MARAIAPEIRTVTIYDEAGRKVAAIEKQDSFSVGTVDGFDQLVGLNSFKIASSGDYLNVIDDNAFEAVLSGKRYFRKKP